MAQNNPRRGALGTIANLYEGMKPDERLPAALSLAEALLACRDPGHENL